MSERPTLDYLPARYQWVGMIALWLFVVSVWLSPLVVVGSFLLHFFSRERPALKTMLRVAACLSAIWLLLKWRLFLSPITDLTGIVMAAPLAPLGAVLISPLTRVSMFLKPRDLQELIDEESERLARHDAALSLKAREEERKMPAASSGDLWLGITIKGDTFRQVKGISIQDRNLFLSESVLDQHIFVLGATGSGKTETIKRLVLEILTKTDRDIFLVDGKGEPELANDIRAMCYAYGRGDTPIFRMGHGKPGSSYNGFCGSAEDVYNRLCALVGVAEAEGNAQFYADQNRDLLQLICYVPEGPPRSFDQVRERLDIAWLRTAWRNNPQELNLILGLKEKDLAGLVVRVRPLARAFSKLVNPQGFTLEGSRSAVFSIRTQSVSDTAKRLLNFLVEDFSDFMGKRQQRPTVFIIDEFGAFNGNQNVVGLLSLGRSNHLGIVLATQDVSQLGDELNKQRILSNTRTKLLMATDYPEEIASLAGTIYQVESSYQHDEGQTTGAGSARIQHQFKIDMNEAGRLQQGEAFIIRQRQSAKIKVAIVEPKQIPPAPPEQFPQDHEPPPEPLPPEPIIEL